MISELQTKTPQASRYEKLMRFRDDLDLREQYINSFGDIRFGKLLEEMDMTAGIVSYAHADGFELDLAIVTAACDRIDLVRPLRSDCNLRFQASVNWVGRSSMEIGIRLDSETEAGWELVARAYFIMVARQGESPAAVHRLQPTNEDERRRFEEAQTRQETRRQLAQTHYHKTPPNAEEIALLHRLFLERKEGHLTGILMEASQRQSTVLMHPQERNIHHKVFGGHLMRESFELAWSIAYLYSRQRPLFVSIDHMYFYKPVEIGSIVSLTGGVIYTGTTSFLVEVTIEVIYPLTGQKEITNICYFTFVAVDAERHPLAIPAILPDTYEEGLKYLDGRKRYLYGKAARQSKGHHVLEKIIHQAP